jgi:chromosome segregation ATPase
MSEQDFLTGLRDVINPLALQLGMVSEQVKSLSDRIDRREQADKELREMFEKNRDKRCELHESDIKELKKGKEDAQKQKWTYGGAIAIIVFLLTMFGPKIVEALSK